MRVCRWTIPRWSLSLVLLAVSTAACATGESTSSRAAPQGQACAARWTQVREQGSQQGLSDGEARRRADSARLECEGRRRSSPPASESAGCPQRADRLMSLAEVPRQPRQLRIYVTCEREPGRLGMPLTGIPRQAPDGSAPQTARAAVDAYLAGVTADERAAGYATVIEGARLVTDVLENDGAVVVVFSSELLRSAQLGTTTFNDRLIAELSATALQFAASVDFQIEGSCRRFAEALFGVPSCRQPVSRERPVGSVGAAAG